MVVLSKDFSRTMNLLINKEKVVQWQYRTILFELQKDGLLGDKYIDDEEVEALLNELGARGWELVNVTMIQEGLFAFCKRQVAEAAMVIQQEEVRQPAVANVETVDPEPVSAETLQQHEREHIQRLDIKRRETMSGLDKDVIGEIKIF